MPDFIAGLPKCELHVHLEGTLERSMQQALARRHQSYDAGARWPDTARSDVPEPPVVKAAVAHLAVAEAGVPEPQVEKVDVADPDVAEADVPEPHEAEPGVAGPHEAEPGVAGPHEITRSAQPASPSTATSASDEFGTLASFLAAYYDGMRVLVEEEDFFDLTMAYLTKAHHQRVLYCEMFFDPQAHTARGVPFDTVISGIHRAQEVAEATLGIRSQLIMCFLRDEDADSAMATLEAALAYREWIVGVGLDSDENGNPPVKFLGVFERARAEGFHTTMHCDPNQVDSLGHLRQCLDVVGVERIDHGVSCLQDDEICDEIIRRGLGLTVCPLSNRRIYGDLMASAVTEMLDRGLRVTCNSDDPAYFGGYMNENMRALEDAGLTRSELAELSKNAFSVSWLPRPDRDAYIARVDAYLAASR